MYEAFDSFLNVDTWYTDSGYDEERFYKSLQSVVRNDDFSPDAMRDYMREKKGVTTDDDSNHLEGVIDRLTTKAWAVRDYLKFTSE